MKSNGVFGFCIKKMWQSIAILLVIIAVVISILKYSLPHIGVYRDDIQQWVRQQYGAEIYIGNIAAGWDGSGPAILLQNISFLPSATTPLDLVIKEVRLKLDFWTSLRELRLTSDYFVLDGVVATIDSRPLLHRNVKTDPAQAPMLDALSQLLLGQLQQFSVTNSVINLNTPSNVEQHLGIEELTWRNDGDLHQGVGRFSIDGFAANTLSFILDLEGTTRTDLNGQLYIEATELDVSPWLTQFISPNSKIAQSNINFQSWSRIDKGLFGRAEINLGDNEIRWSRDDQQQHLQFGQGQLFWSPAPGGNWEMSSNDIQLSSNGGDWPTLNFNLKKQAGMIDLYASQWSVARALDLLPLVDIAAAASQALADYAPQAQVKDFYVKSRSADDWQVIGQLENLAWNNVTDVPGAKDLNGHFGVAPAAGWINIEGTQGQLLTGELFKAPIAYENFDVELSFIKDAGDNWQINGDNIWLHSESIDFVAEFALLLSETPRMEIYGELAIPDLMVADNFYPPFYMGTNSINYLNGAIKGGAIDMAQLLWAGDLSAFPYANNEGIFQVNAQIAKVDFLFTPGWPILSAIDGWLLFKNDSLTIIPDEGYFLDIDVTDKAVARMPSISTGDVLELDIDAFESVAKVAKLFRASPLRPIFNPVFEQLTVSDHVEADAKLLIPLIGDDAYFDANLDIDGEVKFLGNQLNIKSPGIDLHDVTGILRFHNQEIWTEDLEVQWMDLPLQAKLNGQDNPQGFNLAIAVNGDIDTGELRSLFDNPLGERIQGHIPLSSTIDIVFPDSGVRYDINVKADLANAEVSLPPPYQKAAGIAAPLTVRLKGDEISSLITGDFDQRLFFNSILPANQNTFSQAHLILGDRDLGLAGDGFKISLDLAQAQVMPWYDFVDELVNHSGIGEGQGPLTVPGLVAGKIGEVDGFGQQLHGVNFEITEGNGSWDLLLNAKETRSAVHFDRDWAGKGISIKTDYLRLTANEDEVEDAKASAQLFNSKAFISTLPPIDFTCMDCQYGQYDLQRLDIETSTDKGVLNISKLAIVKGKHQFNATGQWVGDEGEGESSITGRFTSDNLGALLNEYDLTSSVRDSNATVDFFADWAGGPHQFNAASLSGEVKWKMGEGHLAEVSDRGTRLLSLLSFDSIVRKLKLDFRDVFSKGFFYNSMKGTMLIESGIAYTDDTKIDGVPADLVLKGSTNLVDNTLNYNLAFTPKYTSSLPTLIAFMVNPISGIAALGLNEVFESKVISRVHFTLTGTVNDPVITETDRKSRDIKLPERTVSPVDLPGNKTPMVEPSSKLKEVPIPALEKSGQTDSISEFQAKDGVESE